MVTTSRLRSSTIRDTNGVETLIPNSNLLERNLTDPEELVRVCLRPNEVLFKTGRAVIYSRLVEGRYPAYRAVFPKKQTTKIAVVAGPFLAAVRQSAIMTDDESKRVVLTFAKKKLTLQTRGVEAGRSKVELPIDYDVKSVEISFDPRFLTDMLKVLDLVAQVAPSRPLIELQAEQERMMQRIGLDPEGRKFTPHVTLARLRDASNQDVADYLSVRGYFPTRVFTASRFVLFSARASTVLP